MTIVATLGATAAPLSGCGGGAAPVFDTVGDQVAQVGAEFKLELVGTDADGDGLSYHFSAAPPDGASDLGSRAVLTRTPSGSGVFKWTPQASDVGDWYIDFTVSDGDNDTTITVKLQVKSAIGSASTPIFRKPLGTGTTLDLTSHDCLDLAIVIQDTDSVEVTLAQEEPTIEGATLEQNDGLEGTWHWCPTEAQSTGQIRYNLTLSADDGDNAKTLKDYLIVLRGTARPECPGEAPVISHSAGDQSTSLNLALVADVTDDHGLKQAPLFYFSTTNPGSNPELGALTQLTTSLTSGTMQAGRWTADVPNPVAAMPAGTTSRLFYLFVADDDDDELGACDHVTQSPVFQMTITSRGIADAGLCGACQSDTQCGDDGDLCVRVGSSAESFCLQDCTTSGCPADYVCSANEVTSVDGARGSQCIPTSGSCTATGGVCDDDAREDNDTRTQANGQPALPPDIYEFTSCPAANGIDDDEDWYKVTLASADRIHVEIAGGPSTDLDLELTSSSGTVLSQSTSLAANETVESCAPAGTYFVHVSAFGEPAANGYILEYAKAGSACPACTDDGNEHDDAQSQARFVSLPFTQSGDKICPSDDDWYELSLDAGDHLTVTLTFTQATSSQDLDLHFHDGNGTDLTPCTEVNPSTCTAAQGQSAASNEAYTTAITASGTYYVRVHGYNGSTNSYAIAMHL